MNELQKQGLEILKEMQRGNNVEKIIRTQKQELLLSKILENHNLKLVNQVSIDWISLNFKNVDPAYVVWLFCQSVKCKDIIEDNFFHNDKRGFVTGYRCSYSYLDTPYIVVSYHPERPEMGVNLQITGKGCKLLYIEDLREFIKNMSALTKEYRCNRLDVAYDDFNRDIPVSEIILATEKSLSANYSQDGKVYFESRIKKNSITIFHNHFDGYDSKNAVFGRHTSARSFRLYDKKIEQKRNDLDYWYRWEIQLRSNSNCINADIAFKSLLNNENNVYSLFLSEISTIIRFLENGSVGNNKGGCKTAEYWTNFLNFLRSSFDDKMNRLSSTSHNISYAK